MAMIYEERTRILRQGFFAVHNEVGFGRQEEAYHQACKLWFAENELPIATKLPHRLSLSGEETHVLIPDFVAWDSIAIEIKAVARNLNFSEWVQVRDYMKFRRESLGLLVNFGLDRVYVQRIVHTQRATSLVEHWEYLPSQISGSDRQIAHAVRDALRMVYAEHSTGYGFQVISRLLLRAFQIQKLSITTNPIAKSSFRNTVVDESPLDCLVINDRFLVVVTALFDSNDFNVSRGRSYLKALDLPLGVAVNFGRVQAQFTSLRA